jgi:hypothetical protein
MKINNKIGRPYKMNGHGKRKLVTFRLPEPTIARIKELSFAGNISHGDVLITALNQWYPLTNPKDRENDC